MTSDQIVYQQRVRALDHARTTGNVAETCRTFGMSRKTFYKWQYADRLADQGFQISKSTAQNLLVAHGLGRRHQRLARAAAIAALTTGLVTEVAVDDEPFGFCHWAGKPGALIRRDDAGNLGSVRSQPSSRDGRVPMIR